MRNTFAIGFAAILLAAPAMGQSLIIQTPDPDAARHEQRAQQDRWDARQERREAESRAAMGDYRGAAEADREAHRDWRDANRQQDRAQDESGGIVIGH
jgi:hypothetical protein